ncbi:trypsin-like serine peptidase [Staphylococcus muscae]|uniref:Serine protease n=1 Tax=Staphylococcus muscae TaxID=1294 RepID=A0A240C893_9STAP|nr:trypsin-like serine protease [Staphylococcus muscae]GGA87546.1 hypothetical protein GCM10007183_09660 [Staphylococcus muscae]SNW04207.1 serine peptidase, S1 family [Staphylococcus muscae]
MLRKGFVTFALSILAITYLFGNADTLSAQNDDVLKATDATEAPTPTNYDIPQEGLKAIQNNSSLFNEKIIGKDTRTVVKDYLKNPYKKIVLLDIKFKNNTGTGTGAMINKNTVLTAAHNVYSSELGGFAKNITVYAGLSKSKLPIGQAHVTQKFLQKEWETTGLPKYDFAILKLDNNLGCKTGYFSFSQDLSLNQTLQIAGYPGDKGSITQYSGKGTLLSFTNDNLFYDVDTYNGESGSPILNDKNLIIGIHTNGFSNYNYGTRINKEKLALIKKWSADPKPIKYNKNITITKSNIKIWKDLNLYTRRSNKDVKLGKVYQAKNIYTHLNGHKYLSLFDNHNHLIGYVDKVDTKDLIATKINKTVKIVSKKDIIWGDFFWSRKIAPTSKYYNKTFKAKGLYTLGNKKKYYTLYNNKNKWVGYIDIKATK